MANFDNSLKDLEVKNYDLQGKDPLFMMFDRQRELQDTIAVKQQLPYFHEMNLKQLMDFWHMNTHALIDEVLETRDALVGVHHGTESLEDKNFLQGPVNITALSDVDKKELYFEIIDQFHFAMNYWISCGFTNDELVPFITQNFSFDSNEEVVDNLELLFMIPNKRTLSSSWITNSDLMLDFLEFIQAIHNATDALGGLNDGVGSAVWKKWKVAHQMSNSMQVKDFSGRDKNWLQVKIFEIIKMVIQFWQIIGGNHKDFLNMYMAKADENTARQQRGY